MDSETPDPRSVVALLANADARRLFALVTLDRHDELGTPTVRESRALARLQAAHLITPTDEFFEVNTAGLLRSLEAYAEPRRTGIDRFVSNGRIVNYPAADRDRRELLTWVGQQLLADGESISESEINERLKPLMDEHVLLRRYLVDYGVLARDPDGSNYSLAPTNDSSNNG